MNTTSSRGRLESLRNAHWRLAAVASAAVCAIAPAQADTPIAFTLDGSYVTSAGVYDADNGGRLVRTLTRGVSLGAGAHTLSWDDRDDAGQLLPATHTDATGRVVPAHYEVRVLKNAVTYTWEGVIGNTSSSFTGPNVFRSYLPPTSMTSTSDTVYFTTGYNEAQPFGSGFRSSDPTTRVFTITAPNGGPTAGAFDMFVSMDMAATDGTRMYWANTGNAMKSDPNTFYSFVAVSDLATGNYTGFSAGQGMCLNKRGDGSCYGDQYYPSVAAVRNAPEQQPTGIAVQSGNGNILAVARAAAGQIELLDKNTGATLSTFTIPSSLYFDHVQNQLAMASNGDLWVLSGRSALRYTNLSAAGGPTLATTLSGFLRPLAVAVSPADSNVVLIADGGGTGSSSSGPTVKAFDASGTALWTLGQASGYKTDPTVQPTKFSFTVDVSVGTTAPSTFQITQRTGLTVLPDDSFWLIDTGNSRLLHFSASRTFIESVAYRPTSYVATVDPGNPSRAFSNFLEYSIDTSHPLQPGASSSWTLVRNWQDSLSVASARQLDWDYGGFHTVATLSNGHTYALANQSDGDTALFELPATGPALSTSITMRSACADSRPTTNCVLYENGDLGYAVIPGTTADLTAYTQPIQYVYRRTLTGFDGNNRPTWAPPQLVATYDASAGGTNHPYQHGAWTGVVGARFPIVSTPTHPAQVVFLDTTVDKYMTGTTPSVASPVQGNEGKHLGAMPLSATDTRFGWEASATGPLDPTLGTYQTQTLDGTVNYGGNLVWGNGENIVYGYHGEGVTDLSPAQRGVGQANQFMHFHDDGLFIGQFGTPLFQGGTPSDVGAAGNSFANILLPTGDGALYWYHNDESAHGGVHRWRIDNLASMSELTATGTMDSTFDLQ